MDAMSTPAALPRRHAIATLLLLVTRATAFDFNALASFVRRAGGSVHASLALADPAPCGARGLVAARDVGVDAVSAAPLVVVPASLEMSGRRARAFLEDRGAGGDDLDDGSLLVLWLASLDGERRRGGDVFWAPYLESLPRDVAALPNAWAPLLAGDAGAFEALLDAADPADRGLWRDEARRAAAYAERVANGLAGDFGAALRVDAADVAWALGVVSSRAMGGGAAPKLVPLLDLLNHDAGRSPFTSFDAVAATVETRLAARGVRGGATLGSGRAAVNAKNREHDGDDWCYWSFTDDGRPLELKAGDEVMANYKTEDYDALEWFLNAGFVPPA